MAATRVLRCRRQRRRRRRRRRRWWRRRRGMQRRNGRCAAAARAAPSPREAPPGKKADRGHAWCKAPTVGSGFRLSEPTETLLLPLGRPRCCCCCWASTTAMAPRHRAQGGGRRPGCPGCPGLPDCPGCPGSEAAPAAAASAGREERGNSSSSQVRCSFRPQRNAACETRKGLLVSRWTAGRSAGREGRQPRNGDDPRNFV